MLFKPFVEMKNVAILIFVALSATSNLFSQPIKILFDATKAQMAGNADWVIDADLNNLGVGSGGTMVTGQGNEANPQQIPTPAQSGITSSTPETYWKGGLSAWAVAMVKRGYVVETLPYNKSITYGNSSNTQDLSNYKVFIVDEPNIRFTSAEKTAILQFVQNGGGLIIVADHDVSDRNNDGWDAPHIWNDLMTGNPFGMTFDYQNFSQTTTNFANLPSDPVLHGAAGNPTKMKFSNGTSMTLNPAKNSTVKGLVYKTGASNTGNTNVMMARCNYGTGRVVSLGDSSPTDDGTGDLNDVLYNGWTGDVSGDHARILTNATIWVAGASQLAFSPMSPASDGIEALRAYPNPASGWLGFEVPETLDETSATLVVSDLMGRQMIHLEGLTGATIRSEGLDISALSPGLYVVSIFTHDSVWSGKVVVK